MDKFKNAFKWHKTNANKRGVEFLFSFDEWKTWWKNTGHWDSRGVGKDKYCMCRTNDTGPYAVWNVYCATNSKNLSDANLGKPKSTETRKKISDSLIGKPKEWAVGLNNPMHKPEAKAKISAATSGGKHYRAKMVGTPHGIWNSAIEAAKCIGISKPTVEWRCRNNYLGFSYLAIA
jgi:hypothetical protein